MCVEMYENLLQDLDSARGDAQQRPNAPRTSTGAQTNQNTNTQRLAPPSNPPARNARYQQSQQRAVGEQFHEPTMGFTSDFKGALEQTAQHPQQQFMVGMVQ